LDVDIRAFFGSVPHDLLLKAVAHHTDERWILLYIEQWLKAPIQMPGGSVVARERGTPQGSPISPLLANLFMHYAFDRWMARTFPGCPFARYADDIVAHCDTEEQARALRVSIAERLGALGLELHPVKTRVVYCKDTHRQGESEHTSFDFLGYTFRGRLARGRRGFFVSFSPAMSATAKKAKGLEIRAWHLNRRSGTDLSGHRQAAAQAQQDLLPVQDREASRPRPPVIGQPAAELARTNHQPNHRRCAANLTADLDQRQPLSLQPQGQLLLVVRQVSSHQRPPDPGVPDSHRPLR
jgi:hypothetical protein